MPFRCNGECTPDFIIKFGCDVNFKSVKEEESATRCVGSLISCCNPNWEVIASILEPPYDLLSTLNQRLDFILNHKEQQLKKGYLLQLHQCLIQNC